MLKSVYRLKSGKLVACETLNSAGEHMLTRRMLSEAITPPADILATGDTARIKQEYTSIRAGVFAPGR